MKKCIGIIMYQTSRTKGQELVAQRMVSYFRSLGNQSFLITSIYHDGKEVAREDQMGEKGYFLIDDAELKIPVIRVASLVSKWPPRRIAFKDIVRTLENIVNDFQLNVLITHSTLWNGPEEVAKFVEWRRNMKALGGYQAPLIFCHMSHYQEPSPRTYSIVERSYRMAWNRLSLRTIMRVANLILVVSPYEEEAKARMGAPRDRLFLFPGGIDDVTISQYSSSDPSEFLQELGLPANLKLVTFLGTIEERKNPTAVLDVAEEMSARNDVRFVIAGRGDSEYTESIRKRAEGLTNVIYLGEVSEKSKVHLIQNSFLNIILSKMEALGLAQLEFMFKGVPVLTSGVGGQSWIVHDGDEGIHVKGPEDIDGAANAVAALTDDGVRWKKLSLNARERASNYTLSRLMEDLDKALTREIEKETGLSTLPTEVRASISRPEHVIHTWSHGTVRVAATEGRVFIQRGRWSRNTLEMPYSSINSVEHVRQLNWRALVLGTFLSSLLFIQHYVFPVISRTLTFSIISLLVRVIPIALGSMVEPSLRYLWLLPISVASIGSLIGIRKGYALHGATINPVFLPASFGQAIQYIREQHRGVAGVLENQGSSPSEDMNQSNGE